MTTQEEKEIRRIWGHGFASRNLISLGITKEQANALLNEYTKNGIQGPFWSRTRHYWYSQSFFGGAIVTHSAGTFAKFLDVVKEIEYHHQFAAEERERMEQC